MEKKELLFGAAYYLEYMPYDRVDEDLAMMKELGMNVIRIAESTWSTLEPKEGTFDFTYLKKMLDGAQRYQMKVIIGTPTYAIPSWLAKKDPDIMVKQREGRALYGRRQIFNIINPTYRFYAKRVIEKLMEFTANYPNVIGFQVDNETKHYDNFSEQIQKLFKESLIDKFQTTTKLNEAYGLHYWSNAISDWDDFPDMRGSINAGLIGEFSAFQRKIVTEFLAWQVGIVNAYRREDQFITQNFDFEWKIIGGDVAPNGHSYGIQPDVDHMEAAKALTIAGTDIYHPTQDYLTGAEIGFCGDEIRCLKAASYLVLECQAQAFKQWTPYPKQLRLHAYSHLASGAEGLLYWNWHSIHNSAETYWKGVLSHDLQMNPTSEEVGIIGEEWKKIGMQRLCIKKQNDVAILVDNRSLTALNCFPIDRELSYNDVVRWMYDSLYEMNIECDVVHANCLNIKDYKVIITPALYCAEESLINDLKVFVENGGILISSFKSFFSNYNNSVYHDMQPHILHECFGMSYNQFTAPGRTTIEGEAVKYFAELLKVKEAEVMMQYQHSMWGKYAGITKNKYKKGYAYYVGCYTSKGILKKVLSDAFSRYELNDIAGNTEWPIIVKSGINGYNKKLHYILHFGDKETVWLCPYKSVEDVLNEKIYKKGDPITLESYGVLALEEI